MTNVLTIRHQIHINIILLGLVSFLTDISSEMIFPLLPVFIISLGGTGIIIGLIAGVSESFGAVIKLFSGYMSDKLKVRKGLVGIGYLTSAIAKLFYPLATGWQHIFGLKILERSGKGLRTAPRDALLSDSMPFARRGIAFGLHRTMDTTGAIVGAFLVWLLVWLFNTEIRMVIFYAGVIAILALIPLVRVKELKPTRPPKIDNGNISENKPRYYADDNDVENFKNDFKKLRRYILIATIFALANFSYMFFILIACKLMAMDIKLALPSALFFYLIYNIAYAILATPVGKLADKYGSSKLLAQAYLLYGLLCIFIFSIVSVISSHYYDFYTIPICLIFAFTIYGLVIAEVEVCQRVFVSELLPSKSLATGFGIFHAIIGLTALPSSFIAGAFWEVAPKYTFLYGAVTATTAAILITLVFILPEYLEKRLRLLRRLRQRKRRQQERRDKMMSRKTKSASRVIGKRSKEGSSDGGGSSSK